MQEQEYLYHRGLMMIKKDDITFKVKFNNETIEIKIPVIPAVMLVGVR